MKLLSTREAYGQTLLLIGESHPDIIVLDADLSVSTQTHLFAKKYPDRFINVGCAEQNLIGTSAGLALAGKIVFASTYAIFLLRAWEQIRNTIAHDFLNVKICATHSGLTNSQDGASHQSLEDIAVMRTIPNMRIFIPADAIETIRLIQREADYQGPAYIRLNREKGPVINHEDCTYSDDIVTICEGDDLAIIACGTMVNEAIIAHNILQKKNISACVMNIHTIKPLDKKSILKIAKKTGAIVTAEEHSVLGGMGSSVPEVLIQNYPVIMKIIGVDDSFGESGNYRQLQEKFGLTASHIAETAETLLKEKRK